MALLRHCLAELRSRSYEGRETAAHLPPVLAPHLAGYRHRYDARPQVPQIKKQPLTRQE